jgi:hypothetical protein
LFFGRESVSHAGPGPAQELPRDGTIGTLNLASKHFIGQLLEALF